MGLPKRPPSLNKMVDTFVAEMGGDRPIYRWVDSQAIYNCHN
jgi:hypothetical protein